MKHAPVRWSSARGALLLGFGALVMLVGGLVGWSVFASIRGAVFVTGWVATEGRNQVVEHIDGGAVREIRVRDGDRVETGELLLRLDDALLRSEEAILQAQHAELVARRNRLEAEFRDADRVAWDPELAGLAAADSRIQEILAGQERLFRARNEARTGEVARMRERIRQAREEIAGFEAQAASLVRQTELIAEELAAKRRLVDQGAMQRSVLLALERSVTSLQGQAGANDAAIARAGGKIAEYEILILQIGARRIEEAEEQAREAQARENEVREQLASVRQRLGRLDVHAPVAGEVFGLTVFSAREVVRPGEPILHIVPAGADLVVRAQLDPIDVDQGVSGPVGHAAVQRVSGTDDRGVLGLREADISGRRARRGHRPVVVPAGGGHRRADRARRRAAPDLRRSGPGPLVGGSGPDAGHAGRGSRPDRGALADQLPGQAADRLFPPFAAGGVNTETVPGRVRA